MWLLRTVLHDYPGESADARDHVRKSVEGQSGRVLASCRGHSMTPENAPALLAHGDVDGLGVGRKGRDGNAFADIVRLIAKAKGLA